MDLKGTILLIEETETVGSNNFRKRNVVLETEQSTNYPQKILIEFVQDKTELLDNFAPKDDVKVAINIRGREWTNEKGEKKYFNSIQGWKIEMQ